MNDVPLKAIGNGVLRFGDIGHAEDSSAIQYNIVRVDGQKSVYLPILKQGGNSNTIQIVNGVRDRVKHLLDVPTSLVTNVVFDQSQYVKTAVANVLREGGIGLVLTALMILIFLGSVRGTISVLISIPVSCLAAFLLLNAFGGTINTMVLGGLALVLSRLIDNSVVVLENIFRHMEEGEDAVTAAERGGQEVQLAVLAATFTTAIVFFPVVFLYGVSKYLFTALAFGVVLALAASYLVAMTVVPLFCAQVHEGRRTGKADIRKRSRCSARFVAGFNHHYNRMLGAYDAAVDKALDRPVRHGDHHHGELRREPGAVSAAGRRVLSAHRSRPVRDQREGPSRIAPGNDQPVHRSRGKRHSRGDRQRRSADDRLQHRHDARSLCHLHQQSGAAHRLRPGKPETRAQDEHVRLHGSRASQAGGRPARSSPLISRPAAWWIPWSTWACPRPSTSR